MAKTRETKMKHSRKTFKSAAYNNRDALQLYIKRCEVLKKAIKAAYYEALDTSVKVNPWYNYEDAWSESEAKKELGE